MTDCLIIGFNDSNFEDYMKMVRAMGANSGAYRDLNLAFIEYNNRPYRGMDILNHFYYEGKQGVKRPFHNADFIWPVVLYLGTYVHRRGFSFDYVNLFHLEKEKLKDKLLHDDILTVAITTTLYVSSHPILEIISFIKQYNERAKIVVGGPYVNNQVKMMDATSVQQLFKYIGADVYVVSQEGEQALANLISALKQKTDLDKVDNIAYRQGDHYVLTASSTESNPLEENMPDYSLFPQEEINEFISLRTAKSCPFSCAFCGFPQRAGKYTYTGVDLIEKDLSALCDLGVTTLTYLDDTFNVPKQRFQEILRMMIRNKYGFKWNSFYRSDHGDEETIGLMSKAGCEGVFLGVESGSDVMLKRMNKTSRRKNYQSAIPLLQAAGISAHANMIVGFPGETYDTVQESIDLIEEAKPDFFRAQLWYADPVTPIWDQRENYGVSGEAFNWSHNTMDSQIACDLIDKIFLSVENSSWLPQYGFEQWSTFYLQRRGMTRDQIKTFVKCFNAAVKEKVINPRKKEVSHDVMESLKRSSQFDRGEHPYLPPIEVLSPFRYKAAEQYWIKEFAEGTIASNIDVLRETAPGMVDGLASIPIQVERHAINRLAYDHEAPLAPVFLAAYSVLLSRLSGREEAVVVCVIEGPDGEVAVPLRLVASWDLSFDNYVLQVREKVQSAIEHHLHGLSIVTNQYRLAEHLLSCPVLEVGYRYSRSSSLNDEARFDGALKFFPEVRQGIGIVLDVTCVASDVKLSWVYKTNWFRHETVQRLGSYFQSILTDAGKNSDVQLGEIALDTSSNTRSVIANSDVTEEFHF